MPVPIDLDIPHVERAQIAVDARDDEAAWAGALELTGFVTHYPTYGDEPAGQTRVRVLSDPQALYVFIDAFDPEPQRIRATVGRRDALAANDSVGVYLDTAAEAQRAYAFNVTASGVQTDGTVMADGSEDYAWDGVWASEARVTEDGWQAELAIPWRTVRHPRQTDRIGLTLFRSISRLSESSSWPALREDVNGGLIQQAVLGGPGELPRSAGLDLIPELATAWTEEGPDEERLGLPGLYPGLTMRWTPRPATSVLATVNPDFAQVESDSPQLDINTRYALSYEEKRPFFLEGQEWFDHPFDRMMYTRSMGAPVYGLRSTVERAGWTGAVLHVLDRDPLPSVAEGGGWTEEDLGDRAAFETVARLRRRVGEDSHVGLYLSDRSVLAGDGGEALGNHLAAVDGRVRLSERVVVESSAMGAATTLTDGEALLGAAGNLKLTRSSKHLLVGASGRYIGPGFRNENGFLTYTDEVMTGGYLTLRGYPDLPWLSQVRFSPVTGQLRTFTDGEVRGAKVKPTCWLQLGGRGSAFFAYDHAGEEYAGAWLASRVGAAHSFWTFRRLELYNGVTYGQQPWYDADDPDVGLKLRGLFGFSVNPHPQLALGLDATAEQFTLRGDTAYTALLGRGRIDAFFTRYLWLRLIADHERTVTDELELEQSGELLLAWERAPGKAVYVGGRVTPPPSTSPGEPVEWLAQGKASWVLSR